MLFHVEMTHTEDNCPAYHREKLPEVLEAYDNLEDLGKDLNVKSHFNVMCSPDHVGFALLEADSPGAVSRYIFSIPTPQETKIVPVDTPEDVLSVKLQK